MRVKPIMWVSVGGLLLALSGCDGGDEGTGGGGGAPSAKDYYSGEASAALGASGNGAKCSTCHSDDGTQAGFSGNTLKDIAYHTSFKGGAADLLGGINACVAGWMGGTALTATDEGYLKLKEYMESISSVDATTPNPIAPEVLADEAAYEAAYQGGDAAAGAAKFTKSCGKCHDGGLVVGQVASLSKATIASRTVGRIAQQVRTSGPPPSGSSDMSDSTVGPMPFFEEKDLSTQDLKDIIAHLKGI